MANRRFYTTAASKSSTTAMAEVYFKLKSYGRSLIALDIERFVKAGNLIVLNVVVIEVLSWFVNRKLNRKEDRHGPNTCPG